MRGVEDIIEKRKEKPRVHRICLSCEGPRTTGQASSLLVALLPCLSLTPAFCLTPTPRVRLAEGQGFSTRHKSPFRRPLTMHQTHCGLTKGVCICVCACGGAIIRIRSGYYASIRISSSPARTTLTVHLIMYCSMSVCLSFCLSPCLPVCHSIKVLYMRC